MRLDPPPRRTPAEPYLPLINIVFLLLIFFLIAARLAPAPPLVVVPPVAQGARTSGDYALYLRDDGRLAHGNKTDDEALDALSLVFAESCPSPCATPPPLLLYVDAQTPAGMLARLMSQLATQGWSNVQLVTAAP